MKKTGIQALPESPPAENPRTVYAPPFDFAALK